VKRFAVVPVLAVGLVLTFARSARADVPQAPTAIPSAADAPDPETPGTRVLVPERHWYGWQILAADAVAGATAVVAVKTRLPPLYLLAALIYVGSGPASHRQNDHHAAVVPSLVARLIAPVVGIAGVVLVETSICPPVTDGGFFYSTCQQRGAVVALAIPLVLTSLVDVAFSWTPPRDAPNKSDLAWAPTLAPTETGNGATLGVFGRF
jgi:hypothetical protein